MHLAAAVTGPGACGRLPGLFGFTRSRSRNSATPSPYDLSSSAYSSGASGVRFGVRCTKEGRLTGQRDGRLHSASRYYVGLHGGPGAPAGAPADEHQLAAGALQQEIGLLFVGTIGKPLTASNVRRELRKMTEAALAGHSQTATTELV